MLVDEVVVHVYIIVYYYEVEMLFQTPLLLSRLIFWHDQCLYGFSFSSSVQRLGVVLSNLFANA